ncbi:MAG: hypothetical protein AB8G15_18640 [Saprospiraceae bacterium]
MFLSRKVVSFLLLLPLVFCSCFEMTEEVYVSKNGSGNALVTLNLSESKKNIANFMKMKEMDGMKIPSQEELEQRLNEVKQSLKRSKGITNVKTTDDFENFIFTFTADFDRVESLNKAINKVGEDLNKSTHPTIKKDNFSFVKNRFTRLFDYDLKALNYEKLSAIQKMVAEAGRFVSIYRFDKEIKDHSNKKAKVSPSRKAIKIEHSLADILTGATSIKNIIKF